MVNLMVVVLVRVSITVVKAKHHDQKAGGGAVGRWFICRTLPHYIIDVT